MSKTEIINEEPNFDEPVVQTKEDQFFGKQTEICLLYTSPSPRD